MNIFNENKLRNVIKERIKEELVTFRKELSDLWEYLNQIREELKTLSQNLKMLSFESLRKI